MFPQFTIPCNPEEYKERVLAFIGTFQHAVFLDSNKDANTSIPETGTRYRYIAAADVVSFSHSDQHSLEELQEFIDRARHNGEWLFGSFTYDLKNNLEKLNSSNPDQNGFPLFHFFSAKHVIIATENEITVIDHRNPEDLWKTILSKSAAFNGNEKVVTPSVSYILNRDAYLRKAEKLLQHIQRGDIYEINYCHEVKVNAEGIDPVSVFRKINSISPNPFSCYYRNSQRHLICASPERFLAKRGNQLISQPIKGTAARGRDADEDSEHKAFLAASEKERSENIMIVDLVRNDLSKVAEKGSVYVKELCGIYTFPKVHQLISTVCCTVKQDYNFLDIIRALFPMGSMTGAPKISAMKLIEEHENFRRSLYSGTVGYINPEGDFDFNVVIRSILFHQNSGMATVAAGSAITAASDPESEYLETLVKLRPQLEALGIDAGSFISEISRKHAV